MSTKPGDDATKSHQDEFKIAQEKLRQYLKEWDTAGCSGKGFGEKPAGAWKLASMEVPQPNQDPNRFARLAAASAQDAVEPVADSAPEACFGGETQGRLG